MRSVAAALTLALLLGACANPSDASKAGRSGRQYPQVLYTDHRAPEVEMLTLDLETCELGLSKGSTGGAASTTDARCTEPELTMGRDFFSEYAREEYRSADLGDAGSDGAGGARSADVPDGGACEDCPASPDAGLPSGGGGGGSSPYRRVTVWPPTGLSESYTFGLGVAGRSADMLDYLDALYSTYYRE